MLFIALHIFDTLQDCVNWWYIIMLCFKLLMVFAWRLLKLYRHDGMCCQEKSDREHVAPHLITVFVKSCPWNHNTKLSSLRPVNMITICVQIGSWFLGNLHCNHMQKCQISTLYSCVFRHRKTQFSIFPPNLCSLNVL